MRNRVSHKFSFYPERYDGFFSCVGCGRCVVSCPVSLDIRHMVQAAVEGATIEIKTRLPRLRPKLRRLRLLKPRLPKPRK